MPLLMTGIAAILLGALAMTIVPIAAWPHGSSDFLDGISAPAQASETSAATLTVAQSGDGQARVKSKCDECGVIQSMRRVAAVGNSPATYEITVRLRDGTTRVNSDASPANWCPGERMILIGGADPS